MKLIAIIVLIIKMLFAQETYKEKQLKYSHVQDAFKKYEPVMLNHLHKHHISVSGLDVFIRVFKKEKELELWAKNKSDSGFKHIQSFVIPNLSGVLGPKEKEHDEQIPEGLYNCNQLIPQSSFFLEVPINFPNVADEIIQGNTKLKGKVCISAEGKTAGNIYLSKENIKELYIYLVEAKNNGNEYLPVYIFPFKMTEANMRKQEEIYKNNSTLLKFWGNIAPAFSLFEQSHQLPDWTFGRGGYMYYR